MFPSPYGDKLFLPHLTADKMEEAFPSPYGDKLFPHISLKETLDLLFPSPYGDKLFLLLWRLNVLILRFRPLTGISCFLKGGSKERRLLVSVPLRG